ncbi:Mercuric transport protein periplasmic component precursor [Sphingopyxis sp. LC81]|uniref:heavy-metal-associated domain-containing protein n=1 Tax=unclassified Sphingopyxis TaxID=2614943 RepID=UPI00050E806C|nr:MULTISPECIES: cation transporter [unclassified Sphingopyxis]KGB53553.1 Mercuric transport protein periplasmic component precursor [Sphingopyxis sp. LC81]MDT7531276.1 cation transporter [Sphingopyxis sp. SE2]
MRLVVRLLSAASLLVAAGSAFAAERTVTFTSEKIGSASCENSVETALGLVPGVSKVDASRETKTIVVTYDDVKTSPEALQAASAKVGYPARLQSAPKAD